jgi:aspartate racemase
MTDRVLGVLGGMGPAATVEFYRRITEAVDADVDQDHPRIVIDSNAKIPDRTAALLHGGAPPISALAESATTLERAGADVLAMPCNTAHAFLPEVRASVSIPVLDMLDETVAAAASGAAPVGLLATSGTLRAGLYQRAFREAGAEMLVPSEREQRDVMRIIELVKAGRTDRAIPTFEDAISRLLGRGATGVVLGCTELSVLHQRCPRSPTRVTDPMSALVLASARAIGVSLRPARLGHAR